LLHLTQRDVVRKDPGAIGSVGRDPPRVFRITDGADDDWASWYAQWLVTLSELPELLGGTVVRSELTWLLVELDRQHSERRPDQRWEDFYAEELLRHFSHG
jgi:hypothetical protein